MAFQTSYEINIINSGEIKGELREVACYSYFKKGVVTPFMLKIRTEEDGEIHEIKEVKVITREKEVYNGEIVLKYRCTATVGSFKPEFKLYYFVLKSIWKIEWRI